MAVTWGTPTPATTRVVQIEPGPTPTLTPSAPASTNAWAPSRVVMIAGLHLILDLHVSTETGAFPSGLPVALLIIPVGYAALRYALAGAAATTAWAILLWLPDLLLPSDQGHVGGDLDRKSTRLNS